MMRWCVLTTTAAVATACLFPDVSGLGEGADASVDAPDLDAPDAAVPNPPSQVDLGLGFVSTFAVDATSIYFMSSSLGGFFAADKTNGGGRVMISGDSAYALQLDASNYYWLTPTSVVQLGRSKGAGELTDLTGDPVVSYAIDANNVYASIGGDTGSIVSAPIGGGTPSTLTSVSYPGSVAVDASRVYFTTGGSVQTVAITGGPANVLTATAGEPNQLLLSGNTVYWVDDGSGTYPDFPSSRIQSIDKSGAPATQSYVTDAQYTITSLVGDGTSLYWTIAGPPSADDAGNETHPSGEVHRMPIGGGAVTVLAVGQGAPEFVSLDDAYVYWVDGDDGTIWRVPK